MPTAQWATPSAAGANIAGIVLNSLANGSASAFVTHDNSTALDLYASVRLTLGSITPTTGGSVTLVVQSAQGAQAPDNTASVGGGDSYNVPLAAGSGIKELNIPMVRLYPESLRLAVINNAGVALAASGNAIYVRPYNESVT